MGLLYSFAYIVCDTVFWAWFRDITVLGKENVPFRKPVILAATHANMVVDPFVVVLTVPYHRQLHFWTKNSLFHPPFVGRILRALGAVAVDRTSKNNAELFKETVVCLNAGKAIAIFPEGTSYTLPHIMALKDGVSWAALEQASQVYRAERDATAPTPAMVEIVPAGITYLHKAEWRSDVIMSYGHPIEVSRYVEEFCQHTGDDAAQRIVVKRLTAEIDAALRSLTVNAPDWETLNAAHSARMILVPDDLVLSENYVRLMQYLIRVLTRGSSDDGSNADVSRLRRDLSQYHTLLKHLRVMDPDIAAFSHRELTLVNLTLRFIWQLVQVVVEIPLFLPGFVFHFPVYMLARLVEGMDKYEECKAQNKIFSAVAVLPILYILLFYALWSWVFGAGIAGAVTSAALTITFAVYHVTLVDDRFRRWESLRATARMWDAVVLGNAPLPVDDGRQVLRIERRRQILAGVELRRECVMRLGRVLEQGRRAGSEAEVYLCGYRERAANGHVDVVSGSGVAATGM